MDNSEDTLPEFRLRVGETDAEIADEVRRCADAGRIVCYFNNEAMLYRWRQCRALHA